MAKVFISYDSEDADFAELVEARLSKAGHNARIDREILDAGEKWRDKLDQAIRESDAMVVIMTPRSKASQYVTYEWAFAIGAGVRVIPLRLEAGPFHPRLDVLHRLEFTDRQRPWEALLTQIKKVANKKQITTVSAPADAPPAVKKAVMALDSLDVNEQVAGVCALADTNDPAALEALTQALDHPVKTVRMAAAYKYPDHNNPRVIKGLIDISRDNYAFIEKHFHDDLFSAMKRTAIIGPSAVPHLLEALRASDDHTRWFAATVLGKIGERTAVRDLIELLGDKHAPVRQAAAWALGEIGENEAGAALIQLLSDEDETTRTNATKALGQIGYPAVAELTIALENESEKVRETAAWALGELKTNSAVPVLLSHLETDSLRVRGAVALSLGKIGDPAALPDLIKAFKDMRDPENNRGYAAQALGLIGHPDAKEPLRAFLVHRMETQQWELGSHPIDLYVAEALLKIGGEDAIALAASVPRAFRSGDPGDCKRVIQLLGPQGEPAISALADLVRNKSRYVVDLAVEQLKQIGTEQAMAVLADARRLY